MGLPNPPPFPQCDEYDEMVEQLVHGRWTVCLFRTRQAYYGIRASGFLRFGQRSRVRPDLGTAFFVLFRRRPMDGAGNFFARVH